jgi:hypothetical protein
LIPDKSALDRDRLTALLAVRSERRLDSGKRPIEESPLFGGPAQLEFFSEETNDNPATHER